MSSGDGSGGAWQSVGGEPRAAEGEDRGRGGSLGVNAGGARFGGGLEGGGGPWHASATDATRASAGQARARGRGRAGAPGDPRTGGGSDMRGPQGRLQESLQGHQASPDLAREDGAHDRIEEG